jgi:hypothetical protein
MAVPGLGTIYSLAVSGLAERITRRPIERTVWLLRELHQGSSQSAQTFRLTLAWLLVLKSAKYRDFAASFVSNNW